MTAMPRAEGETINRKRVQRLMRKMGEAGQRFQHNVGLNI
jgi:transposase InsO family protein